MNPLNLLSLFSILCVIAFCAVMFLAVVRMTRSDRASRLHLCNIAEGVHGNGVLSRRADAATARYRLLKPGSDDDHVALAGAGEVPLYLATDEAAAAEDLISCQCLATSPGTVKLVTNGAGALAAGDLLVAAASGKVAKKAAGAGNYYIVGIAINATAATDGLELEAIPIGSWQTNA